MTWANSNRGGDGGFLPEQTDGTLADGTRVSEVFDEIAEVLEKQGYHREWVDGWLRDLDGAVVTHGYSYRQVRVKRYLPGHRNGPAEAVLDIQRADRLDSLLDFVGTHSELWPAQEWKL